MAFYLEEEVWKCPKHPSKRRRTGVCPTCLRDRLATLCPDCANVRPCSCCAAPFSSPSSSSSSSFSRFSVAGDGPLSRVHNPNNGAGSGGLKRSKSVAVPFLRSRSKFHAGDRESDHDGTVVKDSAGLARSRSTRWFWSMFKQQKSNCGGLQELDPEGVLVEDEVGSVNKKAATMMKSRSVAASSGGVGELRHPKKGRRWYFPSPMKAFRQSNKVFKVLQEAVVYG